MQWQSFIYCNIPAWISLDNHLKNGNVAHGAYNRITLDLFALAGTIESIYVMGGPGPFGCN